MRAEMRGVGVIGYANERIVDSSESFPEVAGARVVCIPEGGRLPGLHWKVLARVWPVSLRGVDEDPDLPWSIVLVDEYPSGRWWDRYLAWSYDQIGLHR